MLNGWQDSYSRDWRRKGKIPSHSHRRLTCLGPFPTSFNHQITSRSIYMNDARLPEYVRNTGETVSLEGSCSMSSRMKYAGFIFSTETWRETPLKSISYTLSEVRFMILCGPVYGRSKAFFAWSRRKTRVESFKSLKINALRLYFCATRTGLIRRMWSRNSSRKICGSGEKPSGRTKSPGIRSVAPNTNSAGKAPTPRTLDLEAQQNGW